MNNLVNYWAKADDAFDRGQQAYLDWCRELAELYSAGITTQEAIANRYGKERVRVTEAIQIGSDPRLVRLTYKDVPRDKYGMYLLTTLPDDAFEELCKPTTTQAKILEYKRRLAAPKVEDSPPPQRPPCPGVEGHGPGLWKWSEAWGEWEQQPAYEEPKPAAPLKPTPPPIDTSEVAAEWKAAENSVEHLAEVKNFQIDRKPESVLGLLIIELLAANDEPTIKAVKQVLAKAYHPDTGRVRKDASLMSDINRCFDSIRKRSNE